MRTKTKLPTMTIGTLAKAAGVNTETVRFYERKGLLKQPSKSSGFRIYSPEDVRKIKFVKRTQELGFTLQEAKEFLDMEICSKSTRPKIKIKAEDKIEEITQKINDLTLMLETLKKFSKACGSKNTSTNECRIINCFENNWDCC